MILANERQQVVEYCRKISDQGLSTGTSGNISIRNPENGLIALSPSGMDYHQIVPEDIVILDADGNVVDGIRKPSSEWRLHTDFYRHKPDIYAIVHTHSMYCTVLATLNTPLRAVHYVITGSGVNEIPVAPYRTFGTKELSDAVMETIGESRGILMENHGMIASGVNIQRAFSLAVNMEFCAELQWRCMLAGTPHILTDEQLDASRNRSKSYGQK